MGDRLEPGFRYNTPETKFVQTPSLSDETKNRGPSFRRCGYVWTLSCDFALHMNNETLKWLASLPILMLYHSGGDSVVLGIAPASPTSWELGPVSIYIRFGVGGTLNSMKQKTPVVGQTIALYAAPADRISTYLVSAFSIRSTSFSSDPQQWNVYHKQ